MLPSDDFWDIPVVVENLVVRFKYWDNTIQDAIQYQGDLYAYVRTYSATERLQAFSAGQEYVTAGNKVCITVARGDYTLWVGLRSRSASKAI